jgi:hypothetical protein
MITSKYFKESEFQACSPKCSLQDMRQATMSKFDTAREIAGIPFVINSAYRSPVWDKSKGRSGTGAHTLGQAMDIRCNADRNRFRVINALIKAGFTRIGVAKTYIHADDSEGHTQEVAWMY